MPEINTGPACAVRRACVMRIWFLASDQEGVRSVLSELDTVEEAKDVIAAMLALSTAPVDRLPELAGEAWVRELGL